MTAQTAQSQADRGGLTRGYDHLIDTLCMLGMGAALVLLAVRWPVLPQYIPTHAGNLASVDLKSTLLSLPLLCVLAYAFLTLLRPAAAALPLWKEAEHNRVPIQSAAVSLLSTLKFWIVAMLLVPAVDRISIAATAEAAFHPLILPLAAACLGISLLSGVRRIRRLRLELPQSAALEPGETALPLESSEDRTADDAPEIHE